MTQPQHPTVAANSRTAGTKGAATVDLGTKYRAAVPAPMPGWYDYMHTKQHAPTRGKWVAISGGVLGLLTLALALVWRAGFGEHMPVVFLIPLYGVALGALGFGCMDYLIRPVQRAQELTLDRIAEVERELLHLVDLMDEELQQRFYRGAAWQVRNQAVSGTEDARPHDPAGGVLRFRRRNDGHN